jgi:hypothetical protein
VGLTVVHPGGTRTIAPRTRRTVLEEMMHAVDVVPAGSAPLAPGVREAMRHCARLVLITDFLGDADDQLALGRTFVASGGELHVIHVVDGGELAPDPKKLLLSDPEQPELRRPMSPPARAEYVRRFAEWRETIARDWRHAGAVYSMVVPNTEAMRGTIRRITTPPGAARTGR